MTDQEINVAIATVCGEEYHEPTGEEIKSGSYYQYQPNYTGDLNAIHSAWSQLSIAKQVLACSELELLCYGHSDTKLRVVNASARLKSEAFLRAEGKWKTSSKMTPAQKASRK
jgi:hypothetical protein